MRPGGVAAIDQPTVVWRVEKEPTVVFDVPVGPRLVVMPAGEFTFGARANDPARRAEEMPLRRVRIGRPLAISMFPITYGEYAWFVHASGRHSASSCSVPVADAAPGTLRATPGRDWDSPGFPQTIRTPAVCVSHDDAIAYTQWLSHETGQKYRLLSEAEYEYASRAGTDTAYWWGDQRQGGCSQVNGLDGAAGADAGADSACDDGSPFVASLEPSKANGFGLFDTNGNVASWTADCWRATLDTTSPTGAANTRGDCTRRVVRGGSWASTAMQLRSAARARAPATEAMATRGFRVAREL